MLKKYPFVFTALGLALVILFIWFFSDIVVYVLVAAVLSVIGQPLVKLINRVRIGRFRIPQGVSALITLVVMLLIVGGFIWFFVPMITNQAKIISQIDMGSVMDYFREPIAALENFLIEYDIIHTGETMQSALEKQITSVLSVATFSNIFSKIVSATGSFFFGAFSILFLTFFFLKSEKMFSNFLLLLVPEKYTQPTKHILMMSNRLLTRYFLGLLTELTCMVTLLSLGLGILGIKNALIIGFFGGLMNIVPYLGPLIGGAVGVFIAVSTTLSLGFYDQVLITAIMVVGVFAAANLIDNILLQPIIYSNVVKAHPVEIFLVIIMAGSLAGIPGMILAIPGYTVLRIVAKEFLSQMRLVQKLTENL